MRKNPRRQAVEILLQVETGGFAEPLLDESLEAEIRLTKRDRALITYLVYGVLRHQGFLDWLIAGFLRGDVAQLAPGLKIILRIALFQLYFAERIPPFAIVNEAVEMAGNLFPGRKGLINAVLRNFLRRRHELLPPAAEDDPLEHLSIVHSHPRWLAERIIQIFGLKEALDLCRIHNSVPPLTVRVNRLYTTRAEAAARLLAEGVETHPTPWSEDGLQLLTLPCPIRELASYRQGQIYLQDEASQLVSHLVSPLPGEILLDLCAGTGGKTSHLAELMGNKGRIFAVDLSQRRLDKLQMTTKRLGIEIVRGCRADGRVALPAVLPSVFDRILVDAPCSGTGTLRRNPEIKWRLKNEHLEGFTATQLDLLLNAARYLSRKGTLVYTTCSLLPEENEQVVTRFLEAREDFYLAPPPRTIPLSLTEATGFFRTRPSRHNTDGFFGAILRMRE